MRNTIVAASTTSILGRYKVVEFPDDLKKAIEDVEEHMRSTGPLIGTSLAILELPDSDEARAALDDSIMRIAETEDDEDTAYQLWRAQALEYIRKDGRSDEECAAILEALVSMWDFEDTFGFKLPNITCVQTACEKQHIHPAFILTTHDIAAIVRNAMLTAQGTAEELHEFGNYINGILNQVQQETRRAEDLRQRREDA